MKSLLSVLSAGILLGTAIPSVKAEVSVSVDFFHDNLESYGDWREVGDYGYCWQPRDVDRDWRPYSDGHWLYTDAGWTWDSEEPYSWAVYHYGRWARVDRIGWVWVPGTEWGPAWVSWRHSPQHVGWAPLPPEAEFNRSVGFSARVDADYDIGPTNYSFVEVRNFGAPRLRVVILEPRQNITIINQTTNITKITYVNNVVYNGGPQYDVISRESAQPIRRLKLARREELEGDPHAVRADQLKTRVEGDSLHVVALPFDTKPATPPRKVAARVEKAEVDHGWKDAGPPAEVAKLRTKIKSEPPTTAEPQPQEKTEKTAEVPAGSPIPAPVPDAKTAKGKLPNGKQPKGPAAPVTTEASPASPEKPAKPGKGGKPVKPEAERLQASPPAAESNQPNNGRNKGSGTPRLPGEAVPQAQVEEGKPKPGSIEPRRTLPPAPVEPTRPKVHAGKGDARPQPEQPAPRNLERNVPNNPEPRPQTKKPESHQQAAPAGGQPQSPEPVKGKGKAKDKEKDEKKDAGKPE